MKYLGVYEKWNDITFTHESKAFTCGHCGEKVASNKGFFIQKSPEFGRISAEIVGGIYICPHCQGPNCCSPQGEWIPGTPVGKSVENLPKDVQILYEEARNCIKNHCYTASLLVCRKILMHISVEKGAEENKNFAFYVDFLVDKSFVPTANSKSWIDAIRKKGNEATHEIIVAERQVAENILRFIQMILQLMYELPNSEF